MSIERVGYVTYCEECGKLTRLTETAYDVIINTFNVEIKVFKIENAVLRAEVNELKTILAMNGI